MGLHLEVTASVQILTDANALAIHSVHEGSGGAWGDDGLGVAIGHLLRVVGPLKVIVTAGASLG